MNRHDATLEAISTCRALWPYVQENKKNCNRKPVLKAKGDSITTRDARAGRKRQVETCRDLDSTNISDISRALLRRCYCGDRLGTTDRCR